MSQFSLEPYLEIPSCGLRCRRTLGAMPGPHRFDPVLLHLVSVARACIGTLNCKEAVLRGRQQSSSDQAAISPDWSSRSVVDQRSCIRMYPRRGSIGRNYTVKKIPRIQDSDTTDSLERARSDLPILRTGSQCESSVPRCQWPIGSAYKSQSRYSA